MKWLLVSDLDGTLLRKDGSISEENKQAIRKFIEAGNYFTLATGRHYTAIKSFVHEIPLNAPCLLMNGGCLQNADGTIDSYHVMDKEAVLPFIKACIERFQMVEIFTTECVYLVDTDREDLFMKKYGIEYIRCSLQDIMAKTWVKAAILDYDNGPEIEQFAQEMLPEQFHGSYSAAFFYEVMPANIHKGTALLELANKLKVHSSAIGDYYNDIEMITMAEIGFACANAPEDIQKLADKVVAHHEAHGVKEAIEFLMN